jgi:thiamine biosynthesis lipoprotein
MSGMARARWQALGTTASVVVAEPRALAPARAVLEAEVAAIDAACSRFRSDSELSRLNAAAGRWVEASPLFLDAVAVALRAAALTAGAVDPTVGGPLILAGYDRDFAALGPTRARLQASRAPGWRSISLDRRRGRVRVLPGTILDLGATAKALAADRAAARAAARLGGAGVLVDLGGDIAVGGAAPGAGWLVRIAEDHADRSGAAGPLVRIRSGGLATSSTTVRRWAPDAHHVIDPVTGAPARSPWRTVSVAAGSCVDANTASTAAIVRGAAAAGWLDGLGLPARLVGTMGDVVATGGWPSPAERTAA